MNRRKDEEAGAEVDEAVRRSRMDEEARVRTKMEGRKGKKMEEDEDEEDSRNEEGVI